MPEKSIREMNIFERQHYSLAARTFRATIMGSIILGLAALVIGLGLYAFALGGQYIGEAFSLARNAEAIIGRVSDAVPLSVEVMSRYGELTEEQLAGVGSDEYRAFFADLTKRGDYSELTGILADFLESSDLYDVYIAMYDRDRSAMVYIADGDAESGLACLPGDWEPVNEKGMNRFLGWDGNGRLYDIAKTEKYGWLATCGYPVKNTSGETVAFVLSDVSLSAVADGMKAFVLQFSIAMFVLVNLVAVLMALHMRKKLVKPVNDIAEAAHGYIADRKKGISSDGHFSGLEISTGDEIENLALVMADMEKELSEYEENLKKITAEKERVGAELALANRIQADILPNIFPAFPERPDFDIYATMTPAKEVGGDFYDFFLIDNDRLGLVMADVSGKGIPAALFMMVSKILIKNGVLSGKSPEEVLASVNTQICSNNREDMFVTVWLGILDLRDGSLTAANAGHEYPAMKKPGGEFEIIKDRHGFVVGGLDSAKYTEYTLKLEPGSKLFLYTDGVPEATDENGELFGTGRMFAALNGAGECTPETVLERMARSIGDFVREAPQFDDVTMMCVHYTGKSSVKEITVEAKAENIPVVTDFVNSELEAVGCPAKEAAQIDVAVDEIFSNIAKYAYETGTGTATVRVGHEKDPRAVTVTFIDEGRPFNPLSVKDPDVSLPAGEREIGGLGLFLVKKTMDSVDYRFRNEKNVLRIRKKI